MKLYLSSYRVPNTQALKDLVDKQFVDMKIALISNAKDYYVPRARQVKVRQSTDFFASLGVKTLDEIDLRLFSDPSQIQFTLKDYDLVWAIGGNSFMLRYEMKRSGFDEAIRSVLDLGIVYGGESAGAIVAGSDLRGIDLSDEADFSEEIVEYGLGLLDNFVAPHVDNSRYAESIAQAIQLHDDSSVIKLTDSQAYVVDANEVRLVEAEFEKSINFEIAGGISKWSTR